MNLNEEINVNEIIIQVLCEQLGLDEDKGEISLNSRLIDDLGADSLDLVEIGFELEHRLMMNDGTNYHDNLHFNCTVKELIEYTIDRMYELNLVADKED